MARLWRKRWAGPARLPSYVRDINTAKCLFCPYGTGLEVGDRVYIWDEKTVFGRAQRERLVEVTAIRTFRTNGRVAILDFRVASEAEVARIAEDSELTLDALLTHRNGMSSYDMKNPPVVVYFQACEEGDDTIESVVSLVARIPSPKHRKHAGLGRFTSWLMGWSQKSPAGPKPGRNG